MPEPCAWEIRPGTYYDPPEFCEEDAVEGEEFCEGHLDEGGDPDLAWKERHERDH